jgi:3-hydroxyacyl-CoA dehydrogenase
MTWSPPIINNRPLVILGAGVLGRRIACVFVNVGYDVHIRDPSEQACKDAIKYIDENKGEYSTIINNKKKSCHFGPYAAFSDIDTAVRNVWLVIEAVPEKLQLKIDTMEELDRKAPTDCIIGSNSSSFKTSLILDKVSAGRRKQIFNMHSFMPPKILAVELMTDGKTEQSIFPFIEGVLKEVGMQPCTAKKESTG